MVCLDSSFLIDFFRGKQGAVEYLSQLGDSKEILTVAAPTVFELVQGAALAGSEKERQGIRDFLKTVVTLPLGQEEAWAAGEVSGSLILSGEEVAPVDLLIGAIARFHDESILTRNTKHFAKIPGLRVEEYP